jgi:hypothetical protein
MRLSDLACMQQTLDETFSDIFDEPQEYGFSVAEEPPYWAVRPWPWPRIPELTDDDEGDCGGSGGEEIQR